LLSEGVSKYLLFEYYVDSVTPVA